MNYTVWATYSWSILSYRALLGVPTLLILVPRPSQLSSCYMKHSSWEGIGIRLATTHVHKEKSSITLESILHSNLESLVSSEGPVDWSSIIIVPFSMTNPWPIRWTTHLPVVSISTHSIESYHNKLLTVKVYLIWTSFQWSWSHLEL